MAQPMDRQDVAEGLDDDKLAEEFPPDEPLGADDYGVTDREEAVEEPIEERVAREEPERQPPADRPVGHLVEPDAGGGPDDEPDAVAAEAATDRGEDPEPGDERAADVGAEEAAVHETEAPPMGDGDDGYIDDEPVEQRRS